MRNLFSAIEKQLKQEQEELNEAEDITKAVFPVIDKLERNDIVNPVILKTKLQPLPDEYRDATYGLCRIATDCGPEGSFIVLDPQKVLLMIDEIEVEEKYSDKSKSNKKFILGFSKKVAKAIQSTIHARLAALCHLVNGLIVKKIINVPATENLKAVAVKISSLVGHKDKSRGS